MSNVDDDHAEAILGLLRANTVLAAIVNDGEVPSPTPADRRYVVVYLHRERPTGADGNALDGLSAQITYRATCHNVAKDAKAARALGYQTSAALLDVVPDIAGRTCQPIHLESSVPPGRPDETTGVAVFDQIDVYKLVTTPAS